MFNPLEMLAPRRGYDTRFDENQVGTGGLTLGQDAEIYGRTKGKVAPGYGVSYNPIQEGDTFRGVTPNWNPGEFAEWKQAHLTGVPTLYGNIMQQRYQRRKTGSAPGQLEAENQALSQRYPNQFPALDMLRRGSR